MNLSSVDLTVVIGAALVFGVFLLGLFVGARITRLARSDRVERALGKQEIAALVALLQVVVTAIQEFRTASAKQLARGAAKRTRRK